MIEQKEVWLVTIEQNRLWGQTHSGTDQADPKTHFFSSKTNFVINWRGCFCHPRVVLMQDVVNSFF